MKRKGIKRDGRQQKGTLFLFCVELSDPECYRDFGGFSVEFLMYFVLEEIKPQRAPPKVQEDAKKPEVTDKPKKLEKRITPQEEVKQGIQRLVLKEFIPTSGVLSVF